MQHTKTISYKEYDAKVQIIITDDAVKTVNRLYKKYNTGMVYKDYIAGFMLTLSMNMYYLIVDTRHLTYNTICHELLHLATAITNDRNVFNEEQLALTQGLLAQDIFNFINSKKLKVG